MAKNKNYLDYNLESIISDKYLDKKEKNINKIYDKKLAYNFVNNYFIPQPKTTLYNPSLSGRPINWGAQSRYSGENAFVQPTSEEIERVLQALHMVQRLPEDQQRQLTEATREIRYFVDGQIRAEFGATNHFNAIRCLNNPELTQIANLVQVPRSQLAGEEFFALNRFMPNFPDIADIQWWSVYKDGSWGLDTWNPEGEHLDTGVNGWGELVGSVMKLNGKVLNPREMIELYRTMKLRNERGFMNERAFENLQTLMKALDGQGSLPRIYEEQLETAHDLGLVDVNGKALTYQGKSMITRVTARQRKQRQLSETDENVRRIIVPTIFN